MTRLLITGVSGLLGINLALFASGTREVSDSYEITGLVHSNLLGNVPFQVRKTDLNDFISLEHLLDEIKPEALINCAAITNIDDAEGRPEPVWRLNTELPGFLAAECLRRGIRFLQVSTDAVFDGRSGNYLEDDTPNPLGVYARSKLAAEQAVLKTNPKAIVARVNFYGSSLTGQRSLAEWFLNNLIAGNLINGFTDIFFCPMLVNDLSEILLRMLGKPLSGLFHVVSRDSLSKYEFGLELARLFGLDEKLIHPVSYQNAGLLAKRSPNLTLCTDKLARELGSPLPMVRSGLKKFRELYQTGYPQRLKSFIHQ